MEKIENINVLNIGRLKSFAKRVIKELPSAKKLIVISPDYTRIYFIHVLVPLIADRYRSSQIDFLNASGTHRPMTESEFENKLGIEKSDYSIRFLNHKFDKPENLTVVGTVQEEIVYVKTSGKLNKRIDVSVNSLIFSDHDLIIVISGTLPHEAAGHSGGIKMFFPGIAGPDVIELFHWVAALVGVPAIIGEIDNKARDIINEEARLVFEKLKTSVYTFNMVYIKEKNGATPIGLYVDKDYKGFIRCYKAAAIALSKVNIRYVEKPLSHVVQVIPQNYDEIWLAGKGSYKLQRPGVLKKGAEVIIYDPHIKCFHSNKDMESDLFQLGYHCRDKIFDILKDKKDISRNAAAHVINLAGPGTYDASTGREDLDFKITLATGIPEEECERMGLSYRDSGTVKKSDFIYPGKLWIDDGGQYLYDIKERKS